MFKQTLQGMAFGADTIESRLATNQTRTGRFTNIGPPQADAACGVYVEIEQPSSRMFVFDADTGVFDRGGLPANGENRIRT